MRYGLVRNHLLNISECFFIYSYVHVPKGNRSKLDNKVEKCIFIGYKMVYKDIRFGIQKLKRLSIVEMLSLERLKMFPNRKSYQRKKN